MIPAAGFGRRFEPLSRVVPKELLLLGDRPLLHHALDEAARAGFESAVIVVSPAKEPLLRGYCEAAGLPLPVDFATQPEMAGLGDAVLRSGLQPPFAVLLPDDVVFDSLHWEGLLRVHAETGAAALCVRPVPISEAGRFGMAACEPDAGRLRVRELVEKPPAGDSPSDLAVFGRYIVTSAVLDALRSGVPTGELQLTQGFAVAAQSEPGVYAVTYEGEILDCGTPDAYARASAAHWQRTAPGRDQEGRRLNAGLVAQLRGSGLIRSDQVAAAFAGVHRHHFLPGLPLSEVYEDEAIPTKLREGIAISSSSQPSIMAIMLEQLRVEAGQSLLEIGAGSGYNAALLGHLTGPGGSVISLDFDQDLVDGAAAHLAAAGTANVTVRLGDGAGGHPPGAPYDRIILTVAAADLATAWADQSKPDGILVLPLVLVAGIQKSVALVRRAGRWESVSMRGCGFMPMRGLLADHDRQVELADGVGLAFEDRLEVPPGRVWSWLQSPAAIWDPELRASLDECWGGLRFSVAVSAPGFTALNLQVPPAALPDPPVLLSFGKSGQGRFLGSCGFADRSGIALLHRDPDSGRLEVRGYGQAVAAAERLLAALAGWAASGRPDTERLRVTALPAGQTPPPEPGQVVLRRRQSTLVIGR